MFLTEQEWFYFPARDRAGQLLVRLGSERGLGGWGDCPCPWPPEQVARQCRQLRGQLAGFDPLQVEELHVVLAHLPAPVRLALESAVWDLLGQELGVPVHGLWGGAFRSRVPLAMQVLWDPQQDSPQRLWPLLQEWHSQGLHTLLIAPEKPPGIDHWSQLPEAWQGWKQEAQLLVDLAGAVPQEPLVWLEQLRRAGVVGVIDPGQAEVAGQALAAASPLPVWTSAGVESPQRAWELLAHQATHALALDPFRLGSWLRLRECVAVAAAAGAPVTLDLRRGWQPTLALGCHVASSTVALGRPLWTTGPSWQALPEKRPLLPGADSLLTVPRTSGSGLELDRAALEPHLVS